MVFLRAERRALLLAPRGWGARIGKLIRGLQDCLKSSIILKLMTVCCLYSKKVLKRRALEKSSGLVQRSKIRHSLFVRSTLNECTQLAG